MEMIASGPDQQQKKLVIEDGQTVCLGRRPEAAELASEGDEPQIAWSIPWDVAISRCHARIRRDKDTVQVCKLAGARNEIYFQGSEQEVFEVQLGEHFVIGETLFKLERSVQGLVGSPEATPIDVTHYTLQDLQQAPYHNAGERLEVLADLQHVIRGAVDDQSLFSRLNLLVLEGIDRADAVAIVRLEEENERQVVVEHWDSRDATATDFRPSQKLVVDAVTRRQSARCFWGSDGVHPDYTAIESLDWAFCTPIPGEALSGWALYVAGHLASTAGDFSVTDLRPDIKFAELVTAVLGALRDVQQLDARQAALSRFFSPRALSLLTGAEGDEALQPRETDVTVLFCDLRGFSREAERSANELLAFLARVGKALDIMTENIHSFQGVVGDFQGDSALAFWGWPLDQPTAAADACCAALRIQEDFFAAASDPEHPLAELRFGIGIASGRAAAGRLGSIGRFKVGVFGPVVNLAARLEAITKTLSAPILVDEATVEQIGKEIPASIRFRKLARILPYGLDQPLTVSEVLPTPASLGSARQVLSGQDVERYEKALGAFCDGRWEEAIALLHELPHWDQGKDFLTSFILSHRRLPPKDWNGVIELDRK